MPQGLDVSSHTHHTCSPFPTLNILVDSLLIFLRNKRLFFSIFALTTFPLSLLLFSLSFSSHHLKSHVYHLESVARLASTHFEARHVWKESRSDAVSLLRIRALFFLPCYALSLLAAVAAVTSTFSACNGKRPSLHAAVSAFKMTWKRPLVTTICVYAILLAYVHVPLMLAAIFGRSPASRFLILLVGSGVEIYLMAVMSMGLVVSITEERYGSDAILVGSGLMAGRRVCGWVLSGLFVLMSGIIARKVEDAMDGQDSWSVRKIAMEMWNKVGLMGLYGTVVLWSFVVTTVFYCDCRKRHVNRSESDTEMVIV
ncbi:uncharacterized protein LOC125423626 [Ziziphus jujuba]|uniref:Uncharacterized protein LOC125423626 n=1 Tax=Ziziphus jujuba TaxID=326968 RepID=A0ABM3IRY3_ZIZJJ|nr:uncharacterized protein LOC125423626 [Ziziphus jujuba]XP_048334285.2 uncharacterized protein LOC125423626 [Ziziphus jujuba]